MQEIRVKMINDLFDMLHACNAADSVYVQNTAYYGLTDNSNDLPRNACNQSMAYGHIGNAIKSLGYELEYWQYIDTGDRTKITEKRTHTPVYLIGIDDLDHHSRNRESGDYIGSWYPHPDSGSMEMVIYDKSGKLAYTLEVGFKEIIERGFDPYRLAPESI